MAKNTNTESGWTGWIGFASLMLAIAGIFHMIAGFVALFQEDVYALTPNYLFVFDYSQWGWIHIFGGLLAFIAAGSLAQGHMYGRIVAVLVAMSSVVVNMAFVPIYPIWSLMMVVVGILVIWAVMVHGKELKED
jgi:hypothetical protein